MKIVKLLLDEESLIGGIDAVALVEQPAIEEDFFMFAKEEFETYNDYPKAAVEAAKQGIKRNKEGGNKCATQVGKVRAQQLANGENISLDTIRRMRSFLIRQKKNYDLAVKRKDYEACGYISYLLWGGPAALPWAEKRLRYEYGEEFDDTEKTIVEALIKQEMAQIGSIDNVAVYETIEEAKEAAKKMGCEGYHEHLDGKDVIGYMPCKSHETAIDEGTERGVAGELMNNISDLSQEKQDAILQSLDNVGITEDTLSREGYVQIPKSQYNTEIEHAFRIMSSPDKGSVADRGTYKLLYKYRGPQDSKNRDFCARMMRKNLLFRKEDVNELSVSNENREFGFYDIFKWRGSFNCRHTWDAQWFKKTNLDPKRAAANAPGLGSSLSTKPIDAETGKTTGLNTTVKEESFAALDDKQMLVGPLMKANKLIKRMDDEGEEYYVYFDADTIEKLAYRFMEDKLTDSVNIEHNNDDRPEGITLVESWLVKDPKKDKASFYGYEPSEGDWFGAYKVNDDDLWNDYVKTGRVKGFSIEGYFTEKLDSYSKKK